MKWNVYPAGADMLLFQGALSVFVCKSGLTKCYWNSFIYLDSKAGGGVKLIASNNDKEKVMLDTEKWIKEEAQKMLGA